MSELFLISGLGADKRVFDFLDLSQYNIHHVEWVDPLPEEPIETYARRLLPQITSKNAIVIGVSFGGVIAIEIGKLIPLKKIILISSVKCKADLPLQNRWIGWFGLNKVLPAFVFSSVNEGLFWFFGVEKGSDKKLLRSIIEDTDPDFLKWGIDQLLNWKNEDELDNVTTIHGTNDRIFPGVKADYTIEGGGHLMIINRSAEITEIIHSILSGSKKIKT